MANSIIDNTGCYLTNQFKGENGTWILIGSESSGDTGYASKSRKWTENSIASTKDEFKNVDTGELMTTTRIKVYRKAEEGSIHL